MSKIVCIAALLFSGHLNSAVAQEIIPTKTLSSLPTPISNNAVALVRTDTAVTLLSFKGLKAGKSWQDSSLESFKLSLGNESWRRIAPVPGEAGELAATAIGLDGKAYVFGGYTVAGDHTEATIGQSYQYDLKTGIYTLMPEIPVAVDDSVSFSVANRYIYLISGWHNSGNVNLSQVYDTVNEKWFQATPYPGKAVFGHAGAAVGDRFVICDGVEKIMPLQGRHKFQSLDSCFRGEVDPKIPHVIKWQRILPHLGKPRYRMAAGGYRGQGDWIVFAGGSDNPYNYDGIGYNKLPSEPSRAILAYSLDDSEWHLVGSFAQGSMDHRSLLVSDGQFLIIGGMLKDQKVTNRVVQFCLDDKGGKLSPCQ